MFSKTKKTLSLLLMLAMIFTMLTPISIMSVSADAFVETDIATAVRATGVKVDGKLDEGHWAGADWKDVASRQEATTLNNDVKFAAAWNSSNLYIAVKVVDAVVVTENLNSSIYNNDGVEIFIDPTNEKGDKLYTENTLHIMFQAADGAVKIWGGPEMWSDVAEKYPGISVKHAMTDDGYIVEACIPFKEIGVTGANDGTVLGLEVTNNDDDNPGSSESTDRGILYWNSFVAADSPATWGNVVLYNTAKPVISYYGTPDVDGELAADEGWTFSSEAKHSSADLSYKVASMCDDKNMYYALDVTGADLTDQSAIVWMFDVSNSKSENMKKIEIVNQILGIDPKDNGYTRSTVGGGDNWSPNITRLSKKTANGYTMEVRIGLEELGFKPEYLDTLGLEIDLFKVKEDYGQARLIWSKATDESMWSSSSSYGSVVFNSLNVAGGKNNAPFGNQIQSHSIPQGGKISGKVTVTDADGDPITYKFDSYNEIPGEDKGTFKLDEKTGEWSYVTPDDQLLAPKGVNYYIEAADDKGGTFHQRIEIRIEPKPTNRTIHVDGDTGSDMNDGTSESDALKTIQQAAKIVKPGDTVLIHETEVPYEDGIKLNLSGLPDALITFKNAPGEQPIINANGPWQSIKATGSYLTIDGLTLIGQNAEVIKDYKNIYDTYHNYHEYMYNGADRPSDNVTGLYNNNGISFGCEDGQGVGDLTIDGVKVQHHFTIRNCLVDYLTASAIGGSNLDYITLENNTLTNACWGNQWACSSICLLGCIDIDDKFDEHKIIIRNNVCAGSRHFVPWINLKRFSDGNGIIIDSTNNVSTNNKLLSKGDPWGVQRYQSRILVANNLAYLNGGSGIHVFDGDNTDVINNTVFANSSTPILNYSDFYASQANDVNMINNIVYSRTDRKMQISSGANSEIFYDNNLFYNYRENDNNLGQDIKGKNGKTGTVAGNNNIYGKNPLFAKAYEPNHDKGQGYPSDWTEEMVDFAKSSGYFPGADYTIPADFDFSIASNSPAFGTANAEWAKIAGLDTKNMGATGVIGSPFRSQTVGTVGEMEDIGYAPADEITVMLDGVKVVFPDVKPFLYQDRTLVPFRAIFEALGATVGWEEATETVTGNLGDKSVVLQINNKIATANGQQIELDVPAMLHQDRTMVPLRFIAESLGAKVDWVDATQTVIIATK